MPYNQAWCRKNASHGSCRKNRNPHFLFLAERRNLECSSNHSAGNKDLCPKPRMVSFKTSGATSTATKSCSPFWSMTLNCFSPFSIHMQVNARTLSCSTTCSKCYEAKEISTDTAVAEPMLRGSAILQTNNQHD